jgi:hypothetical protein
MADEHLLSRREFTIESVLAILAAVTITVTGCDGGYEMGPSPPPGDREGVVSSNHGDRHALPGVAQPYADTDYRGARVDR